MPQQKRSALGSVSKQTSPTAVRFALFVIVALVVCGFILSRIDDLEVVEVAPHFLIVIALQFVPFFARRRADPFEPASLGAFFGLFALVPAFLSFVVQDGISLSMLPYVTGRTRIELVQTVLFGYGAGTIAYYIGYYAPWGRRATVLFPDLAGVEWRRSRLVAITVFCTALFVPAYAYFQARVGASITDVTQLAAGKAVWREDSSMSWLMRATGLGFVPLLLFVALTFQGLSVPRWIPGMPGLAHAVHVLRHVPPFFRSVKGRRALLTMLVFFVVSFLTTRLGQRGTALYVALSALIIVHYLWRRIPLTLILAFTFVALVLTNVLGAYRSQREQTTATMPGPTVNFNATETLVEHEDDRQRFAAMAVVFHYFPDRHDYLMGESWGALAAMFIPRWVWPEKAQMFVWRDTNMIPELVGRPVPVTYLALLYSNFSWVGIVLGMGLLGVYQRGMYEWLLRHQKDKNVVVYYSLAVLYLVPTLIQLSAAIGYLLPVYASILFIKKRGAAKAGLPGRPGGGARPGLALPAADPGPTAAE